MDVSRLSPAAVLLFSLLTSLPAASFAIPLSGRVTGPQGAALQNARLLLLPEGSCGAKPAASAASAADGTFRLEAPAAGPWKVVAEAPGLAAQEIRIDPLRGKTELPPVWLQRTAKPVPQQPLRPGSPPAWQTAVRTVFGRVLNRAEKPISGAKVTLRARDTRDRSAEAATARDGCFEIAGLPAGVYELTAQGPGYAPLSVPGLTVRPDRLTADLGTVVLPPGVTLEGRIVDPAGEPIREATVRLTAAGAADRPEDAPALTGADGSFRIEGRRAGEVVDLEARHEGYAPAAAPRLRVPPEQPLRLVLQPFGGVEGRAVDPDGTPVAGAQVTAVPSDPAGAAGSAEAKQARSGEDGSFRIQEVVPGTVELRATASGRQEARLTNLQVRPGQSLPDVEVVLAPAATITGRVLSSAGRPVPDAEVSLVETKAGTGGPPGPGARTDREGRYRLDGVAPGTHTVQAAHRSYRRTARQIVARTGDNALDLTLERGASIAGRVVDESGGPVADARVVLRAASAPVQTAQTTQSGADGSFTLTGLEDGTYRLGAARAGAAGERAAREVTVAGGPVTGIEIVLPRGGAVAGRLLGLDFTELAQVQVRADSGGPAGQVMPDGSYRIDGVEPGRRKVVAALPGGSRQAAGQVTVEPGAAEARLDLDFGQGLTLTGRVLRNGEALAGAGVLLTPADDAGRWGDTDVDGRFRFEGLDAGRYDLEVVGRRGEKQHGEPVDLAADRDVLIEIRSSSVAGQVVDAADRSPIADARVVLATEDANAETTTDSRGAFLLRDVPAGTWTVRALKADFAPAEEEVRVPAEAPVDGIELSLTATEGLTLRVLLPSGQPPAAVRVAVLDAGGRAVSSASYRPGADGKLRIPGVLPGAWELLLDADGAAPLSVAVNAPGDAGRVVLPPPAGLELTVPALTAAPGSARLRLNDAAGRLFRTLAGGLSLSEIDLHAGSTRVERIAPGPWKLTVTAADGRVWTGTAFLPPGGIARVTLP